MTSSIAYSLVTLTIDGETLFLQLMDVQNVRKIHVSAQTRVTGNSNTLFKMADLQAQEKEILLKFLHTVDIDSDDDDDDDHEDSIYKCLC